MQARTPSLYSAAMNSPHNPQAIDQSQQQPIVFVSGHRSPDIDSLAAACGLAELRRRQGMTTVQALCPGIMPERGRFLFKKFAIPEPPVRNDVYVRIADIMAAPPAVLHAGTTLWDGFEALRATGYQRLPVVDAQGKYLGMLSPMCVLNNFLSLNDQDASLLSGRACKSSIDLMARVIGAKFITAFHTDCIQQFLIYVAAMQADSFEAHLPQERSRELAVIAGDRPEIHLRVLRRKIRLLIVTGGLPVDPAVVEEARRQEVTILCCNSDSASVIRRLPFAVPVEDAGLRGHTLILSPEDKLRDAAPKITSHFEDVMPVIHPDGNLAGLVLKNQVAQPPPFRMILVDHNEIDQSLPGIEAIPVIEIVDHHRLKTIPTDQPIRFTADTVGSTCTIVAGMFKEAGQSLSAGLAGLLLSGIVTDTLNLRSPTTSPMDEKMAKWLSAIAKVTGEELMEELSRIASPLAASNAADALSADRKKYSECGLDFALAQIEETNLELLAERHDELATAMEKICRQEKLECFGLLVTDPVRENSRLMLYGKTKFARALPYRQLTEDCYDLPGVLSRKKQLLPQILTAIRSTAQNS